MRTSNLDGLLFILARKRSLLALEIDANVIERFVSRIHGVELHHQLRALLSQLLECKLVLLLSVEQIHLQRLCSLLLLLHL